MITLHFTSYQNEQMKSFIMAIKSLPSQGRDLERVKCH